MSVVDDLYAALREEVQAAGPGEVDVPSPASTRGTPEGRDGTRRRQKSDRLVVERVESVPWPTRTTVQYLPKGRKVERQVPDVTPTTCARWRAQVAQRSQALDAEAGAPSVMGWPDSDQVEDEQRKTFVWLTVRDAEGAVWVNVPPWEVEELPQPVAVLEREERPIARRPLAPVVELPTAPKRPQGQPSKLTPLQIEDALDRIEAGERVVAIARQGWQQWGFSSEKSCENSLRRWRRMRGEAQREEAVAA